MQSESSDNIFSLFTSLTLLSYSAIFASNNSLKQRQFNNRSRLSILFKCLCFKLVLKKITKLGWINIILIDNIYSRPG